MLTLTQLKKRETLRFASFDIGRKNFAFYVEEFNLNEFEELKQKQKPLGSINLNTRFTPQHHEIIEEVCKIGTRIDWDVTDLDPNSKTKYLQTKHYIAMTKYLDQRRELWESCDAIIIEQQTVKNPGAMKLGQHCMSYFLINWGETKYISTISSSYKTKLLGAPKTIKTKPQRKRWCIDQAKQVMISREDKEGIIRIAVEKKQDDLGDTCMQLQAFKYKNFVC